MHPSFPPDICMVSCFTSGSPVHLEFTLVNDKKYGPRFLGKVNPWNIRKNECQSLWCRPLGGGPQGSFCRSLARNVKSSQDRGNDSRCNQPRRHPSGKFPSSSQPWILEASSVFLSPRWKVFAPTSRLPLDVHRGHSVCGDGLYRDVTRPRNRDGETMLTALTGASGGACSWK